MRLRRYVVEVTRNDAIVRESRFGRLQPVVSSALDFFFGKGMARVPPSTSFHDRLADLLLTSFSFAAEDPGAPSPPPSVVDSLTPAQFLLNHHALNNAVGHALFLFSCRNMMIVTTRLYTY